jgi:TolB-like protein
MGRRAILLLVTLSGAARAATPTVAVMPFRDLSGGATSIGEAIRETVTSDLKQLADVRVIERGNLDKILAEQNLQSQRSDLDPSTAARVGRLLGATLIVAGAYQEAPPQVRLTARFVKVETGEIVGTAKVDGKSTDLLKLQDKITARLLEKAGLVHHVKRFEERARPPIKSLKTMDLYGQAVVADNDDNRRQLLQAAVAEDATFTYAVADLAALEKRMRHYQAKADVEREKAADEARAQLAKETDPAKAAALSNQVMAGLLQARRHHQLIREARNILAHPPPAPPAGSGWVDPTEMAFFYLVTSEVMLKDRDGVLRDGEAFMRKYPKSMYFSSVKMQMEQAITQKRDIEEGKAKLQKELAELSSERKWDLCDVARQYRYAHQYAEAQRLFRACLAIGKSHTTRQLALQELVFADIEVADWAAARKDAAVYEKVYELQIPTDG